MNSDQFAALIARLEPLAQSNPSRYERRVILLALAGYTYLGTIILLLLALLGGTIAAIWTLKFIAIKVVLIVVPFLWLVLKALWIKFPAPEGVEITQEYAPDLFAMIDKLRRQLRCARFHHVLITGELNAAVQQNPRLGPFGWYRNYLLIGLPLMKALTPAQLEAVLAHEFGHLAGGHGAVANHIYRLRLSWARLLETLSSEHSAGMVLFLPFFKRFSPYFNAYSFPLARANEYHADKVAAQLCGARVASEALTGIAVVSDYLGTRFWPDVHKQAETTPQPAFAPYRAMSARLNPGILTEGGQTSIDCALKEVTSVDNTHPAFGERLKALGEGPLFAPPAEGSASDLLLGSSLQRITDLHDEDWTRLVTHSWRERYASVQKGREKLAALETRERSGEVLTPDEEFQYAMLIEDIGADKGACLARLRVLHARAPEHAPTCYHLGLRLLGEEDNAGVALVEKCMALEPESVLPGCEVLAHYCRGHQLPDDAARFQRLYEEKSGHLHAMHEEESTVKLVEKFEAHGLPDEVVDKMRAQLLAIGNIRKVYLAKRQLKLQPDKAFFAMGFIVTPWWKWQRNAEVEAAVRRIIEEVDMPAATMVFCVDGANHDFKRKFRRTRGSRIL